jgi:hypothetical protein
METRTKGTLHGILSLCLAAYGDGHEALARRRGSPEKLLLNVKRVTLSQVMPFITNERPPGIAAIADAGTSARVPVKLRR